jgi:hypothetical protein
MRGSISQTAVGRLDRGSGDQHDVGFWYWAYRPEATVKVSIPHVQAEVGTRITMPLTLTVTSSKTDFLPRAFHARIRFNRTILRQGSGTPPCDATTGDCVIEIDGTATAEGPIAQMEFITALGDSEGTPLTIEEFTWQQKGEERIATARENGDVTLLGICRQGGQIRLIKSGEFASRVRVWPNPATTRTTLEYVAAEAGPVTIRLVDLFGNDVTKLVSTDVEAERLYQTEIDLSQIPSGSYTLVYSTPTQMLTQHLIVTQ